MDFVQSFQNNCHMVRINHRLPLKVALSALLFYGLSVSWETTLNSLPLVAKVAGWDWIPMTSEPLTWLLTLPLRGLSAGWIPGSLNLFFAVCGALTLGILARSIELLPWDCLPEEENHWLKSLPVLLACAVGGLQFNFWQEATAASGAMLNQLLLAAAIWCLLEYRVAKTARWVNVAALIWGLGMAQSWVMLLNLPLFVAGLIWLRGLNFFRWSFLLRMALLGLAGFSIYALLPLVNGLNPHSPFQFGGAWLATLKNTRNALGTLYHLFRAQHLMTLVVVMYFLVPILPCLVRLKDLGGQNNSAVERFQMWLYRGLRVGLLLACLWLAFAPSVGPQQILAREFGLALPLLSFDYLNALGIGFLAGNFLFVSQIRPDRRGRGLAEKINTWLRHGGATAIFAAAAALIFVGLVARNAPALLTTHRQPLEGFGELVVSSLPAGGGVVLGEDGVKLAVIQAALSHHREKGRWQVANFALLPLSEYRAALDRQQPHGWRTAQNQNELSRLELLTMLDKLAHANRFFFLQPSPGNVLFEVFYPQPEDAVAELKFYDENQVNGPSPLPQKIEASEKFWDAAWQKQMEPLSQLRSPQPSAGSKIREKIFHRLHLEPVPVLQSRVLASWYSVLLDSRGVELQRSERLPAARHRFEQALALSPNHVSAGINLRCNTRLQAGKTLNLDSLNEMAGRFRDLRDIFRVMNNDGPFDEPGLCYQLGRICQQAGWPRQTVQLMERTIALAPGEPLPKVALAELYSFWRMEAQAFDSIKRLKATMATLPPNQMAEVEVEASILEAKIWMLHTNFAKARPILQSLLEKSPNDLATAELVFKAYLSFGDLTNALELATEKLAKEPDNFIALNNRAAILLQMNRAAEAVPILNHALLLTNLPQLRVNRAIAYFQSSNLPAAEAEYLALLNEPADVFSVHFGLAAIAEQRHDTNVAIHHYTICLSNAPAGTAKWEQTRAHLAALKNPDDLHPAVK